MSKQSLYNQCLAYVQQRIDTATEAMRAAQESANSESKSSAGDKYETGRAMAQLERDRHAQLLADAQRMLQELQHIDLAPPTVVRAGSLVKTTRGTFFISISAGRISVDGNDYMAVSAASPIGTALRGKRIGDTALFNNVRYVIEAIE
ncbi:3-oxoacyl-ACP synthase [Fibrella arboris]|uniref:3-oxoacyl-ACP synthase n=1 Tax=Fibrella arboris TaxID=3242486 RepID=UPI0035207FBD